MARTIISGLGFSPIKSINLPPLTSYRFLSPIVPQVLSIPPSPCDSYIPRELCQVLSISYTIYNIGEPALGHNL